MTRIRQIRACFVLFFLTLSVCAPASLMAGMIRDSELEAGFEKLSNPMAIAAGIEQGITIRIIINPSYNAFVAGGRTVYLHSGLLLKARSAEEILGVIAHEIGHLAAGHVPLRSEAVQEANLATALATVAAAAAAAAGSPDAALGLAIGGVDRGKRAYLKTSRRDESIADEWALQLLDETGISSFGLADVMRRLSAQNALPESRQSEYYSTHPGASSRLATFNDHIRLKEQRTREISLEDMRLLQRLVIKLAAYVNPPRQTLQKPLQPAWPRSSAEPATLAPDDDIALYEKTIAQYRYGELAASRENIQTLLARHPDDPWYLEFAGDIYLASAEAQTAARFYQAALAKRDGDSLISLSLGRALISINQPTQLTRAVTALETSLESDPDWAFAKRQLAIAYGRLGKKSNADILLAEEALINGDRPRAIALARRVLGREDVPPPLRSRATDILLSLDVPLIVK
jgi:predicted Zn-dependent protease